MFIYADRLYHTLVDIIRIPSTSGHEEYVRSYLEKHLIALGLTTHIDSTGNLVATLDGEGTPILLNAHMDRVPPGLGHEPIMRNGIIYSDGSTNLGADDVAGITIIMEVLRRTVEQDLPHPPLVVLFTVQEESGLCGAHSFDGTAWNVRDGIVFDNAFEAGIVVSKGAAYEAFNVKITGHTGHPGKDLTRTINALTIFKDAVYPQGPLAFDQTRINIGRISGGNARNTIPETITLEGEMRSFEPPEERQKYKIQLQEGFEQAAQRHGGRVEISFHSHTDGYVVNPDEPLLNIYQMALAQRGATLEMKPTFIGSDTGGFRPNIRAFTLSTGVVNEHTVEEYVALAPLEQIVNDTLQILHLWHNQS